MNHYGMSAQLTINYRLLHGRLPSSQIIGQVRLIMIAKLNELKTYYHNDMS
jgi:hypothetical protein